MQLKRWMKISEQNSKGQLLAARLRLASHELSFMMILCDSVLWLVRDIRFAFYTAGQ